MSSSPAAKPKVCGATGGTFSCQRPPHPASEQHKSLHSIDVLNPGSVLFVYWGAGQAERTTRKQVVVR